MGTKCMIDPRCSISLSTILRLNCLLLLSGANVLIESEIKN